MVESGIAVIIFSLGFLASLICLLLIFFGGIDGKL